jgi:hypothetical protein
VLKLKKKIPAPKGYSLMMQHTYALVLALALDNNYIVFSFSTLDIPIC